MILAFVILLAVLVGCGTPTALPPTPTATAMPPAATPTPTAAPPRTTAPRPTLLIEPAHRALIVDMDTRAEIGYAVRYRQSADRFWTIISASSTPVLLTGLQSGMRYEVQGHVSDVVGWGPWSETLIAMPK